VRAIVMKANGGPEVLELQDVPEPQPGRGRLLVRVEVAGVNFRDVYEREGAYGTAMPAIAGAEGAGTVVEVGPGVTGFSTGERVAWKNAPGSYAEQVAVPAGEAVPLPDGLTSELAAAALLQGVTAQYLATTTYPVRPGDVVVVHAAAGGVGHLLTQIVKLRGGVVLATASSEEKRELARQAGADHVMGYEGFAERAWDLTEGAGAAVVYDGVGRATFDESLKAVRTRGTLVLYGAASGRVEPFDPMRLENEGSIFLTRPSIRHYAAERDELLARAGELVGWIADGRVRVSIGARYPLEQARQAQEDLAARRTTGKLLLVP
jgi:NADPH:quinone reductase